MSPDDVARWFDDYLEVFAACGRGERPADALLSCYGVPLLLSTDDGFLALTGEAEVVAMVEGQVAGMRTAGYHHSDVLDLDVTPLNTTSALCRGTFARLRADGSELGRLAATYLLTEASGVRRISALAVHAS